MKFTSWLVFVLIAHLAVGQDLSVQSRINNLYDEGVNFRKSNPERAKQNLRSALTVSAINGHFRHGQIAYMLGDFFMDASTFDSAYFYYLQAIGFMDEGDPTLGRAFFGKAYVEFFKGQYEKSLASAIQAEKIARALSDTTGLARAVKLIGGLAETENDYNKSIQYFKEALVLNEAKQDTLNIIRTLNSLATPYCHFKEYEIGEKILLKAVELAKRIDCKACMAVSYSQLGVNDFYWGKYERSITFYQLEQSVNRQLGGTFNLFYANQNIAESLVELKRLDEALIYNDSALQIGLAHKSNQFIHDAYKVRYAIQKQKGKVTEALSAFEKQMQYKDSLYSTEKAAITEDLKALYDTERKERQIKELEQTNTIKDLEATTARQWQIGLIVFLILLTIVVGVLYNRYQLKQRTAKVLDQKNSELQKLNGFKDRMFAVISHDLRNPVDAFSTIIEGLNQNLQHASKEELKEFLESTLDSAKDLKSLLNNLLEWSLVQIGKLPFDPKPVPLNSIVAGSVSHLESMASLKKIQMINSVDGELILADREMITIIIRNLVSNAIKFSKNDSVIELKSIAKEGSVVFTVKDEGIGMKPEELSKLFKQEENMRTIGSSSAKGAGIGLLLCKELTDKNGGKIYAESEPGKGSTFYLELPTA